MFIWWLPEKIQQNNLKYKQALNNANAVLASGDTEAINQSLLGLITAFDAKVKQDRKIIPGSDGFIRCSLDHPCRPGTPFCDECGEGLEGALLSVSCLFVHDFFQDGRLDALSEVRILQHYGEWTKEKRTRWIRQAVSTREHLKHTHPHMHEAHTYYAGRVATLKSLCTIYCTQSQSIPAMHEQTGDKIIYRPLPLGVGCFCGTFDCGNDAIWGVCISGDIRLFLVLCDICRQEWVRAQTAYTAPDGWDWDEHEDQLLHRDAGPCIRDHV